MPAAVAAADEPPGAPADEAPRAVVAAPPLLEVLGGVFCGCLKTKHAHTLVSYITFLNAVGPYYPIQMPPKEYIQEIISNIHLHQVFRS